MKISQMLKAAKAHLQDGKGWKPNTSAFVCIAVRYALSGSKEDITETLAYVEAQLEPHQTFEEWLLEERGIAWEKHPKGRDAGRVKLQATRKAWVNHMIKELRKEGK